VLVFAHTGGETSVGLHKKLGALKNVSSNIISYTSFQIQMSLGKMLHKRNYLRTRASKIRGNIGLVVIEEKWGHLEK